MPGPTLRKTLNAYLRRLVDETADGNRRRFAAATGVAQPDVTKGYSGTGNVSLQMIQRIADAKGWPMSRVFRDLEGVARDLDAKPEAFVEVRPGAGLRPELVPRPQRQAKAKVGK